VLSACRYFRYTRVRHHAKIDDAAPSLLVGRTAEAEILPRGIESGAVKRICRSASSRLQSSIVAD
jgi:hypothetical protein